MKDIFCIVPWIHLNPEPSGNVKPCCGYFPDDNKPFLRLQDMTLEEMWNSDFQKDLRKKFLNNELPGGCKGCVQREDSYNHSLRMAMNERFGHHIEHAKKNTSPNGHYDTFQLYHWDFRFSNICNFKCRMCGHSCSSQWHEETQKFYMIYNLDRPKIMDKSYYGEDLMIYVDRFIDIVEEIYFAGGEPLIMPEHYEILDKLIDKKRFDVFLRYNTNLSTLKYKSYDLIQIWKKFHKVEIFVSIDGYGENAEYSRHGTDWSRVDQNLKLILESGLEVRISLTVNVFNIFHIPDFLLYLVDLDVDLGTVIPNILSYPPHYMVSILPDNLKIKVKEKFRNSLEMFPEDKRSVISSLYDGIYVVLDQPSNEKDVKQFYYTTNNLDEYRGEDITKTIPEFKEWFDNIIVEK